MDSSTSVYDNFLFFFFNKHKHIVHYLFTLAKEIVIIYIYICTKKVNE